MGSYICLAASKLASGGPHQSDSRTRSEAVQRLKAPAVRAVSCFQCAVFEHTALACVICPGGPHRSDSRTRSELIPSSCHSVGMNWTRVRPLFHLPEATSAFCVRARQSVTGK